MTLPFGVPLPCPPFPCGCLACSSINWRLCSSCCRCICCCNNSMLSSRAATSFCKVRLSASSPFNFPLPKREPTFATNAVFASVLAASSFSDLISFRTLSSRRSACRCSVCNFWHVGFKLSRLPFQVTVVLGGGGMSCFRTTNTALQAGISPSLRRSCRGRRQAFHVSAGHRRTGARRWLFLR